MAALILRLANVTLASAYGELIETDQTAANTGTGWTVAKTGSGNSSDMAWATANKTGFTTESTNPKPTAMGTSDTTALRTQNPYTGTFAATAWTLTFAVRATTASSQAGRCRVRVYTSPNADGSGATERTGSTQVGTTSAALSTSADVTSVVTWTPGAAFDVNNEYVFVMVAWEITTASGSNSGNVLFRTGTSAAGTRIVTSNLSPLDSATVSTVTTPSSTETSQSEDSNTVTSITSVSAAETAGGVTWSAVAGVAGTTSGATSITSHSETLSGAIAVGDVIVVTGMRGLSGGAPLTGDVCTDNLGNVYSLLGTGPEGVTGHSAITFYTIVSVAGTPTITITFPSARAHSNLNAQAYRPSSGVASFDCHAESDIVTAGGTTITAGDVTPAFDGSLIVASFTNVTDDSTLTADTNYTQDQQSGESAIFQNIIEHRTLDIASIESPTVTIATGKKVMYTVGVFNAVSFDNTTAPTLVQTIGTNKSSSQSSPGSLSVTVPAGGVPAGHHLVVAVSCHDNSVAHNSIIFAVSDSKGNMYDLDLALFDDISQQIAAAVFSTAVSNALVSGDTVTVSYTAITGPGTALSGLTLAVYEVAGLDDSNWADKLAVIPLSSNSTTVVASPSVSTSRSNEILFGIVPIGTGGFTLSATGSWTLLDFVDNGAVQSLGIVYQIVSSKGSYNVTASENVQHRWMAGIVTYRGAIDVAASSGIVYTDADTPSTITTLSAVEVAAFIDSTSVPHTTSLAGSSEVAARVDSNTVGSISTPSAVETAQRVDSATISSTTVPSATELHEISDSATASSVTTPSSTQLFAAVDAATVTGTTAPSAVELHEISDRGTIATVTALSAVEVAVFIDSATLISTTMPSSTEVRTLTDAATVSGSTTLATADIVQYIEAATVAAVTTPSAIEVHELLESATISSVTALSATELSAYIDASTIASITAITAVETAQFIDAAITSTITNLGSIEAHTISDANAVNGITTPSSADIAVFIDAAIIVVTTTLSSLEEHGIADASTVVNITNVSRTDTAQYVDAFSIATATSISVTELHEISDSGASSTLTNVSSTETAQFVDRSTVESSTSITYLEGLPGTDEGTIESITTPTSADVASFVDAASVNTITSLVTIDEHVISDAGTVPSITSVSASETAQFVDTSRVSTVTTPFSIELHEIQDAGMVAGTTSLVTTDIADYVDAFTTSSFTTVIFVEGITHADADSVLTTTLPSSSDIAGYVDTTSVSGHTDVSANEVFFRPGFDATTVTSKTTPTSADLAAFIDSASLATQTSLSAVEFILHGATDSATVESSTLLPPVEVFQARDAASIHTTTTPTSSDIVQYVDTQTTPTRTSILSTETPVYADSDSLATTTSLTYSEIYTPVVISHYLDAATVTSTTYVFSTIALHLVNYDIAVRRFYKRFSLDTFYARFGGKWLQ